MNHTLVLIMLAIMFMMGGHLLDIGNIAQDRYLTSGFYNIHASKVFHIGLFMMYFSFIALILLYTTPTS
jgi:hypothetical protein|tara:strand:- start:2012 stop:2218 length:207 start_codon:yes stop_codon:yes gene_type:complete